MTKGEFDWKKWLAIGFLGIGEGSIYFLPYIRNVYYTPMLKIMGVTNADMGWLMSFFAIGCMIMYIPGGVLTDTWDYKKCITISLAATAVLVGTFAFWMNYAYAEIVWILMAFSTTFVFWTATIKAVRMLASKEEQGRVYSIFYAINGAAAVIVQTISLALFQQTSDPVIGLRTVLLINAGVLLFCALMCQIFVPSKKAMAEKLEAEGETSKFNWKDVGKVVLTPHAWLIVIVMFCVYGVYTNVYWFSSYLTDVKGMSASMGETLGLIRNTYMMFVCSLLGSVAVGAFKKRSTYIAVCTVGTAVACFLFLMLQHSGMAVLGIISLLPSAFMLLCYGVVYSLYEEYKIPIAIAGTAIGFVSILGYTPDLLFGTILGGFVDRAKAAGDIAQGYMHIFEFFGVLGVVGAAAALLGLYLLKRKASSAKQINEQNNVTPA
jgi:MFS family permease